MICVTAKWIASERGTNAALAVAVRLLSTTSDAPVSFSSPAQVGVKIRCVAAE
jgi:hypothetical protein